MGSKKCSKTSVLNSQVNYCQLIDTLICFSWHDRTLFIWKKKYLPNIKDWRNTFMKPQFETRKMMVPGSWGASFCPQLKQFQCFSSPQPFYSGSWAEVLCVLPLVVCYAKHMDLEVIFTGSSAPLVNVANAGWQNSDPGRRSHCLHQGSARHCVSQLGNSNTWHRRCANVTGLLDWGSVDSHGSRMGRFLLKLLLAHS